MTKIKKFDTFRDKSKPLASITEKDLLDCLKDEIPSGWEIFNYHIDKNWQGIKIRRQYGENEIDFNEDGYEYKTVFLSPNKSNQYKVLIQKGYNV